MRERIRKGEGGRGGGKGVRKGIYGMREGVKEKEEEDRREKWKIKRVMGMEKKFCRKIPFFIHNFVNASLCVWADVIEALSVALLNELEQRMKQWPAVTDLGMIPRSK